MLQIGKHCFLPLPRAKEYLFNLSLRKERALLIKDTWLYKKKKKSFKAKGQTFQRRADGPLQVVFTD